MAHSSTEPPRQADNRETEGSKLCTEQDKRRMAQDYEDALAAAHLVAQDAYGELAKTKLLLASAEYTALELEVGEGL